MNKEVMESAPFLDMAPGLHGIKYPAKYLHAPKSAFPGEAPAHPGEHVHDCEALRMSLGK